MSSVFVILYITPSSQTKLVLPSANVISFKLLHCENEAQPNSFKFFGNLIDSINVLSNADIPISSTASGMFMHFKDVHP